MKTESIECANKMCPEWNEDVPNSCDRFSAKDCLSCKGYFPHMDSWVPDRDGINFLPEPLRRFIHDLETRCDPAGEVGDLILTKDQNKQLQAMIEDAGIRLPEWELKLYVSALEKWTFGFQLLMFAEEFSEAFKALHKMFRGYARGSLSMSQAIPIIQEIVDLEIMSKQMLVAVWQFSNNERLGDILFEYNGLKEMKLDYLRYKLAKSRKGNNEEKRGVGASG